MLDGVILLSVCKEVHILVKKKNKAVSIEAPCQAKGRHK
jgi:hypothetical protein